MLSRFTSLISVPWFRWRMHRYLWSKDATAVTDNWAGYHVLFPLDRKRALRLLAELQKDRFLDKATREIRIDYTVSLANLQKLRARAIRSAVAELPASRFASGRCTIRTSSCFAL